MVYIKEKNGNKYKHFDEKYDKIKWLNKKTDYIKLWKCKTGY
jgi:hypothetical protein